MNKKELYMFKRYFYNDKKVCENGFNKISIIINIFFVILCILNCNI